MNNWETLSELDQNRIVSDGIQLMTTITEVYGADEGMKLWENISQTLGDDVKSAMFFAMLTGSATHRKVRIMDYPPDRKVSFIKAIREATGLTLKEAKDISEQKHYGRQQYIEFTVPQDKLQDLRKELYNIGIECY